MLMTDRIFARLLYRELLDGDEARIAALSRTVLQKPFHSIVAAVREGRLDVPAREVALSLVGFALGQVQIGRASGRERVCQYVEILVGSVSLTKKRAHKVIPV